MHASRSFVPLPVLALVAGAAAKSVSTTPHDSYSSSVGVLGCKIDTDRVAYWPGSVDCNNICVKLSYQGRSVHLLRIDQSGGAHDISYDAWNYLQTGKSAATDPIAGGGVAMDYEEVDASECADLIHTPGSKLPLSASNSMNYLSECLSQPNSWVAKNHVLYNICDAICTLGYDETCTLDLATSNQPSCSHTLGLTSPLTSAPVYNIEYQTGQTTVAGSGKVVSPGDRADGGGDDSDSGEGTDPTPGVFVEQRTTTQVASSEPASYVQSAPPTEATPSATGYPTSVAPPTTTTQPAPTYSQGTVPTYSQGTASSYPGGEGNGTYVATTMTVSTVSEVPTAGGSSTSYPGSPTPTSVPAGQPRVAVPVLSGVVVAMVLGALPNLGL